MLFWKDRAVESGWRWDKRSKVDESGKIVFDFSAKQSEWSTTIGLRNTNE